MKPEIAKIWTDALRSGNYDQCTEVLVKINKNDNKSFCCLGVLCDLADKNGLDMPIERDDHSDYEYLVYGHDKKYSVLPEKVLEWSGVSHRRGKINTMLDEQYVGLTLTILNDNGFTFSQIADVIDYFKEEL